MAQVEINITGRIPKYLFCSLKEKYKFEIKQANQYFKRYINENDFLNLIFNAGLYYSEESINSIFNVIDSFNLEKLPNFNILINDLVNKKLSHFEIIDYLFDYPDIIKYGSAYGIPFFEENNKISIVNVYGSHRNTVTTISSIIPEMNLKDFADCHESYWSKSLNNEDLAFNDFKKLYNLKISNLDFGFTQEDEFGWYKNIYGSNFISTDLNIPEFKKMLDPYIDEHGVTILFDEIINWCFYIELENEDFDLKNLTFVNNNRSGEFRGSSRSVIFNHLFYKNQLILADENWIRHKNILLMYGNERGWENLDFFINGQ